VFSLSRQAQALTESRKDRIADRLEVAVAVDRLESRGLAEPEQAAQLQALAEDIRTGDGGPTWGFMKNLNSPWPLHPTMLFLSLLFSVSLLHIGCEI
jgi:hypothetical protein